ncbi:hypothetical protein [Mycobacterium tuberculosis]|nr:hypothetical protein [Mycobacterium tuberculosis]MCW1159658.1 hypothetical protein [Mycobacterium tuberculosis]MCW1176939.1 hypothetical protein [Mycobacterium tuberculosis]MCW1205193.1 hypothetical protein [Mycobacterium tuberculosis]MCW1219706.1 hypothetical protein [Mycobacterium tuberculosis]
MLVAYIDESGNTGDPANGGSMTFALGLRARGRRQPADRVRWVAELLAFPDSAGGYMRGSHVRRRWWSQAVTAAQLFPQTVMDATGKPAVV